MTTELEVSKVKALQAIALNLRDIAESLAELKGTTTELKTLNAKLEQITDKGCLAIVDFTKS